MLFAKYDVREADGELRVRSCKAQTGSIAVPQYRDNLTIARGIASVIVVVSHSLRAAEVPGVGDVSPLLMFFDVGSFAVVVFLVLSGVSLYLSHDRQNQSNGMQAKSVCIFYVKRICRIWPAFVFSLVAYLLFRGVFQNHYGAPTGHWIEMQFLGDFTSTDLAAYLFLCSNFFGSADRFNNAYWSLPIEFQFYLLFPLLILTLSKFGIYYLAAICIALFSARYWLDERYALLFTLIPAFIGGIMAVHISKYLNWRLPLVVGIVLCMLVFAAASGFTHLWYQKFSFPIFDDLWNQYVILGVLIVSILLITEDVVSGAAQRILHYLGEISYSMYLYHNLFIGAAFLLLANVVDLSGTVRFLLIFIFTMCGTLIVSSLSYRYIERPFIAMGARFAAYQSSSTLLDTTAVKVKSAIG